MKKALAAPLFLAVSFFSFFLIVACEDDDVGIPCQLSEVPAETQSSSDEPRINLQALDCRSRLCLSLGDQQKKATPQCTKICEKDEDCPQSGATCPNDEKFVCIATVQTGALACCKMCVCRYFLSETNETAASSSCQNITPNCPKL